VEAVVGFYFEKEILAKISPASDANDVGKEAHMRNFQLNLLNLIKGCYLKQHTHVLIFHPDDSKSEEEQLAGQNYLKEHDEIVFDYSKGEVESVTKLDPKQSQGLYFL